MATKLSDVAKAAMVIEHGGREYILSPLEIEDLADAQRWAEERPFEAARRRMDILGDQLTAELRAAIYQEAVTKSAEVTNVGAGMQEALATMDGTIYLLYLALRRKHSDMTVKLAGSMVSIDSLVDWQERLDRISGLSEEAEKDGDDEAGPTPTSPPPSGKTATD